MAQISLWYGVGLRYSRVQVPLDDCLLTKNSRASTLIFCLWSSHCCCTPSLTLTHMRTWITAANTFHGRVLSWTTAEVEAMNLKICTRSTLEGRWSYASGTANCKATVMLPTHSSMAAFNNPLLCALRIWILVSGTHHPITTPIHRFWALFLDADHNSTP